MTPVGIAAATVIATIVVALITAGATLWRERRKGPTAQMDLVQASTILMAQLQVRVAALEARVAHLEGENAAYREVFGPLPQ